ncbi:hypothetical protein, partial [Burkholderia cepacia]|uniref:hypothetical protein n=1 Tax=Burkholderia cepacia TaxID=292 RepID=UPI0019554785
PEGRRFKSYPRNQYRSPLCESKRAFCFPHALLRAHRLAGIADKLRNIQPPAPPATHDRILPDRRSLTSDIA